MIFLNKKGFTLIELIITIIISALIMVGLFNFIVKINEIMVVSQNKSSIYSNLTDFIENYQNKKNTYSSGNIIVDNPTGSGFDTVLFTNNKGDKGFIVGVVNVNSMKIDNNFSIYGNKVLGIKPLTNTQINNLLGSGTVYDLVFNEDNIYPYLQINDFSVIGYNSGTILEATIQIQESYNKFYEGKNINIVPYSKNLTTINLVF